MQYKQNIPKGFLQLSLPFFFFFLDVIVEEVERRRIRALVSGLCT